MSKLCQIGFELKLSINSSMIDFLSYRNVPFQIDQIAWNCDSFTQHIFDFFCFEFRFEFMRWVEYKQVEDKYQCKSSSKNERGEKTNKFGRRAKTKRKLVLIVVFLFLHLLTLSRLPFFYKFIWLTNRHIERRRVSFLFVLWISTVCVRMYAFIYNRWV